MNWFGKKRQTLEEIRDPFEIQMRNDARLVELKRDTTLIFRNQREFEKVFHELHQRLSKLEKTEFQKIQEATQKLNENGKSVNELLGAGKILVKNVDPKMDGIYQRATNENPSRQHLEKCLHEKNVRIKELEAQIEKYKNVGSNIAPSLLNGCCCDYPHVGKCSPRRPHFDSCL